MFLIKRYFDTIVVMRLVIQRVSEASVRVSESGKIVGKIGLGLFVLVGVKEGDTEKDSEVLAEKLAKLRVMSLGSARDKATEERKMNYSVKDVGGEILAVSQFTLIADTSGGNRPSFIKAAKPLLAEKIYNHFVDQLREQGIKVETGKFGEYMEIEAVLDGPVTILLESNMVNSKS